MKQNLHTHSGLDDGKGTLEEIVLEAIDKGFDILGFSGHSYVSVDDAAMSLENTAFYQKEVERLKEKYKDQITIYCGLELDGQADFPEYLYDYLIGSIHFLKKEAKIYSIDASKEEFETMLEAFGSMENLAKAYYKEVERLAGDERISIIGHLDLISKFNEEQSYYSFDDPMILEPAYQAIDTVIANNKVFEINTGAISRGYRTSFYPEKHLLDYIVQKGGKLVLNSDSHQKENLDFYFKEALKMLKDMSVTELFKFEQGKFIPVAMEEWKG